MAVSMTNAPSLASFAIEKTDYQDRPFPYLVVDDLFPARLFGQILDHWPDDPLFSIHDDEDRQKLTLLKRGVLDNLPRDQADFWRAFVAGAVQDIVVEAMAWFGRPLFEAMAAGDGDLTVTMVDLLQLSKPFTGIPAHTHYHSPLLLGTCIIYVDDAGETTRGTNVLAPSPGFDDEDTATELALGDIEERRAQDMLQVERHVAFQPNRALILMDGPISWHGATAAAAVSGPRRQIIINWALGERWMDRRHGVTINQFSEDRILKPRSKLVRDRVALDIQRQLADRQYALETARALFKTVPIDLAAR